MNKPVAGRSRGQRELVTVVGHAAEINPGEWITVSGEWVNDREHGLQFKATFLRTSPPTSAEGMAKYLGSGMIRGIGPIYASKVIDRWSSVGGLQTLPMSRHHANLLAEAYRMANSLEADVTPGKALVKAEDRPSTLQVPRRNCDGLLT
jgi:ATP-dependent exoDNAse (exonuclease V) alpha subunit